MRMNRILRATDLCPIPSAPVIDLDLDRDDEEEELGVPCDETGRSAHRRRAASASKRTSGFAGGKGAQGGRPACSWDAWDSSCRTRLQRWVAPSPCLTATPQKTYAFPIVAETSLADRFLAVDF